MAASAAPVIHIIHDNVEWIKPYRDELKRRGVQWREWLTSGMSATEKQPSYVVDATTLALDFEAAPAEGVFFQRSSTSAHTRGAPRSMDHALTLSKWAEAHGRRVLGGSRAMSIDMSKAAQEAQFREHRIRVPKTKVMFCHGDYFDVRAVRAALVGFSPDDKVVLKPSRGGSGSGVRVFTSPSQAELVMTGAEHDASIPKFDASKSIDGQWLVQQYVESPEECVYRLEFVKGELLYAVRIDTSDLLSDPSGDINNCPADSCEAKNKKNTQVTSSASAPTAIGFTPVPLPTLGMPTFGAGSSFSSVATGAVFSTAAAPAPPTPMFTDLGSKGTCPMKIELSKFRVEPDFWDPIVPALQELIKANQLEVCGIEIVIDAEGLAHVIDLNCCNTNYNIKAEKRAGIGPFAAAKKAAKVAKSGGKRRMGGAEAVVDALIAAMRDQYPELDSEAADASADSPLDGRNSAEEDVIASHISSASVSMTSGSDSDSESTATASSDSGRST